MVPPDPITGVIMEPLKRYFENNTPVGRDITSEESRGEPKNALDTLLRVPPALSKV